VENSGIWPGLSFLLVLQISAVLFNLIPLPPFDGYNAVEPFLSPVHPRAGGPFPRRGDLDHPAVVLVCPVRGRCLLGTVFFISQRGVDWNLVIRARSLPLLGTIDINRFVQAELVPLHKTTRMRASLELSYANQRF
jgi:hypothetical protein